jgi:hypothetical protein
MPTKKKILFALSFFVGLGLASLMGSHASADAFNQNDLIDDPVFNNQSMSAAQINSFLNTFPSSCISTNSGFYTPDPTGWSAAVTTNHGYTFAGNVSGGQAIYDAARIYNVNPEVILATLQKEQSVVTGGAGCHYSNPSPGNACTYSGGGCVFIAMSYGCPSGCSVDYSTTDGSGFNGIGNAFSLQLIAATWLLRWSQERSEGILSGYTGFDTGDDAIYYSGPMLVGTHQRSASSTPTYFDGTDTLNDGTSVTIGTGGTAALYYYTPFISGNTHFDSIYNSWFGTQFSTYSWQPVSQQVYLDSSLQTPIGWGATLEVGQTAYVVIIAANTGDTTWSNTGSTPIDLGTAQPGDRASPFCDAGWLGCPSRPTRLMESSVAPGQWGEFEFPVTAPSVPGQYDEHFNLLAEGLKWFNDPGQNVAFNVIPLNYSWQLVSQAVYTDSTRSSLMGWGATLLPGQSAYAVMVVANTSNFTWTQTGPMAVELGTDIGKDRSSAFCTGQWPGCNRPAMLQQTSVAPGQWGTFTFPITAPASTGVYNEHFNLVSNAWFNDPGEYMVLNVVPRTFTWQPVGQALYSDASQTTLLGWGASLSTGQTVYAKIWADNTSNFTWTQTGANAVELGTSQPNDRSSAFCTGQWPSCNRPALLQQASVAPGQWGSFLFPITAPSTTGTYNEHFNLVSSSWFSDPGQSFVISVH